VAILARGSPLSEKKPTVGPDPEVLTENNSTAEILAQPSNDVNKQMRMGKWLPCIREKSGFEKFVGVV